MRTGSFWMIGLLLSAAACTITNVEHATPEATDPAAEPEPGSEPASAPAPNGSNEPGADDVDASAPPAEIGDAGAPLADAGADADAGKPKQQIPVPTFGYLHASTKNGEVCDFTVNGILKGTGSVLDVSLVTGTHTVACKKTNGAVATQTAVIVEKQTTSLVFDFPANGTLVAVAIDGVCAFYVNGAAKGTTSKIQLSLPPATYLVECKPAGGATLSRSVVLKSGETAMSMFQL